MSENNYTKKQLDFIRLLEDPYAKLSFTDPISDYITKLGNPYAKLCDLYVPEQKENWPINKNIIITNTVTKKEFNKDCKRIFMQYIPHAARKKIRPEHLDFITRNENRTSEERFILLNELKKYDISCHGEYHSYFNREHEELTDRKLRIIEKSLDK